MGTHSGIAITAVNTGPTAHWIKIPKAILIIEMFGRSYKGVEQEAHSAAVEQFCCSRTALLASVLNTNVAVES